jgi:hypothetical protein
MKLRIVSGILWFLAGWVLTGVIAFELGVTQLVGAVIGVAWAAFVTIDPKHLIWGDATQGTPPRMSGTRSAAPKAQVGTGA